MTPPGRYDIAFTRGDRLYRRFTFRSGDPATLIDLTGCSARLQVRTERREDASLVADLTASLALGGALGTVTLDAPGVPGGTAPPAGKHWWSLVIVDAGGRPRTWLEGQFTVADRVTLQA